MQAATPTYYDGAYHAYVRARLKCHIHYLARSSFDQILDLAAVVFFIFYKYFPITYQEYMASRAASIPTKNGGTGARRVFTDWEGICLNHAEEGREVVRGESRGKGDLHQPLIL